MQPHPNASLGDLLALVAGTLSHEDFVRVAQAVKNDTALQGQLAIFERIRSDLIEAMVFDKRPASIEKFAENLVKRIEPQSAVSVKLNTNVGWLKWIGGLFQSSAAPARIAYCLVAIQTVGIVWLMSGALLSNDGSAASTRSTGADTKQLGTTPASATFSVSFDPATPESTIRGLLLELEAQIISGPSRLGQYKVVVARNRSQLTMLKLQEAAFVEQVTEINAEEEKQEAKAGGNK